MTDQSMLTPDSLSLYRVHERASDAADLGVELSIVVPVYNSEHTLSAVVEEIHATFAGDSFEVVLVNDGSTDGSERVARDLAARFPHTVCVVHLARNFGEHSAVLAGMHYTVGDYVAVLDDDGQNPPAEVARMVRHARTRQLDVVYGRHLAMRQPWLRRLGSRFHDRMANLALGKPPALYLSSFKVLNRFLVDELLRHHGPRPYLDGLILQTTASIGQVDVLHRERRAGRSGYSLPRLMALWLDMVLGSSLLPLRIGAALGLTMTLLSGLLLLAVALARLFFNPQLALGIPAVVACVGLLSGVQLTALGIVGEYVTRALAERHGAAQHVVRYAIRKVPVANSTKSPSEVRSAI